MEKVVFICEIGADIDDTIAAEYLFRAGRLDYVVLDRPQSKIDSNDLKRLNKLKKMGIAFRDEIRSNCRVAFCGGAFTKVERYIIDNELDLFVANGGFAGDNLVENLLPKFKGKTEVPTFNLNCDVKASQIVFRTSHIRKIRLVTKNVCHSEENTYGRIHKDEFLIDYKLREGKRLHDLLMVKEGLAYLDGRECLCDYAKVMPYLTSRKRIEWGSIPDGSSNIEITIGYKNEGSV